LFGILYGNFTLQSWWPVKRRLTQALQERELTDCKQHQNIRPKHEKDSPRRKSNQKEAPRQSTLSAGTCWDPQKHHLNRTLQEMMMAASQSPKLARPDTSRRRRSKVLKAQCMGKGLQLLQSRFCLIRKSTGRTTLVMYAKACSCCRVGIALYEKQPVDPVCKRVNQRCSCCRAGIVLDGNSKSNNKSSCSQC